jgi:Uma2 family endonuclease
MRVGSQTEARKMKVMDEVQELIEAPLSREELAMRYRSLCEDPCFANVPGKIEIDLWGRMVMTPASPYHGRVQVKLADKLAALGGERTVEAPIATPLGLFVADLAWSSRKSGSDAQDENPLMQAPELCIEVASPSNSRKELREKIDAYLSAGAEEVWIVYLKSKRCEVHGKQGLLERSRFAVELADLFD